MDAQHPQVPAAERLAGLQQALHDHGQPLTIQRRVLFESLLGRTDHPTADEVLWSVRDTLPGLSRTTVYRVLETFVSLGVVRKVDHPGSAARFDPRVDRHAHGICTGCGAVTDLELSRDLSLAVPRTTPSGFQIDDYSVHFTGLCPDCQ